MRRALSCVVLAISFGLAVTACSGGGSSPSTLVSSSTAPAGGSPSTTPTPGKGGGAVDCSALTKDDLASYLVYTQVIAQVRDQASAQGVRDHPIGNYTPAKMSTILTKLQVLAGHPAAGFGDPGDSLAYYTKANEILGRIVATSGDVPQPLVDEYTAAVGDTAAAISKQLPINAALSEHCPNVS